MFCNGIFLQHAQQSTNEMVRMVCYTVFAQNRYKNQKYHLIVDMIKYLTFFSFCKNKGACGHMKLQNKSRRRRGILRCLHKEKWHRAAHGMHPVTKKLLHIGCRFCRRSLSTYRCVTGFSKHMCWVWHVYTKISLNPYCYVW